MNTPKRLDAYHFFEQEWEDYDQLYEAFEWEAPETFNIADYCLDRWAADKARVALFYEVEGGEQGTLTFWQLRNYANQLANYMRDQGLEKGDRVAIIAPQRPEIAIAYFAAWKIGAVTVPLNTLFGPDALAYRFNDSGARLGVLAEGNEEEFREARGEAEALETVLTVGDVEPEGNETEFWEAIEGYPRSHENEPTRPEDDAILIYTSGTTGNPKGVRHGHQVVLGHLPGLVCTFADLEIRETDVFWTPAAWAWVAGLTDILTFAMFYGRPVLAHTGGGAFDAETTFALIEKYGLSVVLIPPTALRMMMQVENPQEKYNLDSIRVLPSGGESLTMSIVEWAEDVFSGAAVHEAYGQTEANLIVGDCTTLFEFREGTMGRALPGHEVAILDTETAEPIEEPGTVGEIGLRYEGDLVCLKEYWNKPEATAAKIRDGWLLTEDLGSMDEDGYITFGGRTDDVIISSGYRIGPEEVEDSIAGHPAVADAGVIGIPDEVRGEIPKAFVVLAQGYEAGDDLAAELMEHVKERLAKYEYPREIEFIDELPQTVTGKIRRQDLRKREGID